MCPRYHEIIAILQYVNKVATAPPMIPKIGTNTRRHTMVKTAPKILIYIPNLVLSVSLYQIARLLYIPEKRFANINKSTHVSMFLRNNYYICNANLL